MAETELHEKIVLEGAEQAEGRLHRLAGAATKLAGAFEGITEVAGVLGGIGAAWKLAEGFQDVNRLYGAVSRISSATGMAAAEAHGMFEAFEKVGLEADTAEGVMVQMARMAGKVSGSLSVTGEQAQHIDGLMKRLGVSVKNGPQAQMIEMARAAEKGKLTMQDLVGVFGVQRSQAERMLLLLQRGPEKIKDIFEEVKKSGGVIDDAALESFRSMGRARAELLNAWQDVVKVLYKSVIPVVTKVLITIKDIFMTIAPIADKIGEALVHHMELVVGLTKTWLTMVAANKILNMFGEKKMPLIGEGENKGRITTLLGGASRLLAGTKLGKAGGMDYFAAKEAFPAGAMFQSVGGPIARVLGSVAGRFAIIGVVIGTLVAAFELLKNNTLGLRTMLMGVLRPLWDHLKTVIEGIIKVMAGLFEAVKPILAILGGAFIIALTAVAKLVEALGWVLDKVMRMIVWAFNHTIAHLPGVSKIDLDEQAKDAASASKREGGEAAKSNVYQDFRGSKFEIENNFPQGIDGGRVAVAFGDEMARLGERRVDSGLRPLYSYR